MQSSKKTISIRKLTAFLLTLAMVATQFAALPVLAADIIPSSSQPGVAKVVLQIPDDVTIDSTNGEGKTDSEFDGLVVTMKRGLVTTSGPTDVSMNNMPNYDDPYWWDNYVLEYTFTEAGIYTIYSRGPGYYRIAKMFNVSQSDIDEGNIITVPIPNSPLGEEGYQPGQWQTFADRKATDYTGNDYIPSAVEIDGVVYNVSVNIDSRDHVILVWPDELREWFGVTPEAFARQKELSGNTNEPRFHYPEGGLDSVAVKNQDSLALYEYASNDMLEAFIEEKLNGFTQGTGGVYVYYTSLCQSPVYGHDMPFLVFSKDPAIAEEDITLDEVAEIIRENGKVTVWHQGAIHANEPAATEGLLAVMSEMFEDYGADVLDTLNVLFLPRVSVDSSKFFSRANFLGADPNREHLNADSPEQVAIHQTFQKFMPELATDGHEFTYGGLNANGYMINSDDLESTEAGQLNVSDELQALSVKVNDLVHENALDAGLRVVHYGPAVSPGVGRAYYNLLGTVTILVETRGIGAGGMGSHMERRAYSQYVALKSVEQYALENAEEVKQVVAETRESLVDRGKSYDPDDSISLDYMRNRTDYTVEESPRLLPRYSINLDGTVTREPTLNDRYALGCYYRSTRDRTRPTAYILPLNDVNVNVAGVKKVLDAQLIDYYVVAPGTTIGQLSQYYYVGGSGITARADLRDEGSVTFASGALVVPMDQVNSAVIAMTFEPDVNDSYKTTLVNQKLLAHDADDDNNYPLYRYQGDNPSEIAPGVEYELILEADGHLLQAGDTFNVDTYFEETMESNTISIQYTFDGDLFEYQGFTPASGLSLLKEESGKGYVNIMLGALNGYELQELGQLTLLTIENGTGYQNINAWAEFVLKDAEDEKYISTASGTESVLMYIRPDSFTLIDLSNIIDWFGIDSSHPDWRTIYTFWDFNNSGDIEIYDVVYVAKNITD